MSSLFLVERRQAPRPTPDAPPDAEAREQALDIRHSWIVEAPAGSGKTGLLIQRLLKLLADQSVTEPEQVLAITFTVKATGELRDRVLSQLEAAATAAPLHTKFDRETRQLAEAVLRRDAALGWHLLENPTRLRIRTIDSVCAEIARSLPVLSGSGGQLAPILDAAPLYREAARRTFLHLGADDGPLHEALHTLLLHRDGNLADCERLLADMLSLRDQWGTLVPLTGPELTDADLDGTVLPRLERSLDQAICAGLQQLAKSIPTDILESLTHIASELGHMAGYEGSASPFALCANLRNAPGETADHLDHWRALIHLLTTRNSTWRKEKGINKKSIGVHEYDRKFPYHGLLRDVLEAFSRRDDLLLAFAKVRCLPPAKYPSEQWHVAKALFRILHRALVELQLVFATRGECDFTELGLLARAALRRDTEGDNLAAALGLRLQHLLVDEMQDTSTSQYDLIELLTHGWDGQSQTVFLVGDPKQSIYLFRQARVERFVRAMRTGKLSNPEALPFGTLRLSANFRSQSTLVDDTNADFALLFPREVTPLHPEDVPFVAATPVRDPSDLEATEARAWHAIVLPAFATPDPRQPKGEALAVRRLIEAWRAQPLPPGRTRPWSLAVLVRNRLHLTEIVAALKRDESATSGSGPLPFRAVDIEALDERQEILDLLALTRALLHPADRVAWLAILRAPWCGLTLTDLHLLAGADDPTLSQALVQTLIPQRRHLLSPDGRQRLDRAAAILQAAAAQRARLPLSQWIDQTWRALGGHLYLTTGETANTLRFFHLLDELEHGDADLLPTLQQRLKKLYAESPPTPGAVELLTIHKAKGLEWDVVFVPGLERKSRSSRSSLLTWTELDAADPHSAHIVLAPIPGKGEASRELNDWIRSLESAREAAERKRLFYVASTRAREELHLFGALQLNAKGEIAPAPGTLLHAAWLAAESHFATPPPLAFVPTPGSSLPEKPTLALAAAAETAPEPPPPLHRLPGSFQVEAQLQPLIRPSQPSTPDAFTRPEGSFAARALGNAVHAFLELVTIRLTKGATYDDLLRELPQWTPRIQGLLRASGLPPAQVDRLAQRVLAALTHTLTDEIGRWILAPHPEAATEQALTTWQDQPATVRLDRIFRAGPSPTAPGNTHLWIVDFKTATHAREGLDTFLQQERTRYQPQMQTYAQTLAPTEPVRLMLFYSLLPTHIWWEA